MTAVIIPIRDGHDTLRQSFADSLTASDDEIELRAAIEERVTELNAIILKLGFIRAAGRKPGSGTALALEYVASRLIQMAEAMRLGETL